MTFEVGVKLQTGERFEIEADGDETVGELKKRIEVSFFQGSPTQLQPMDGLYKKLGFNYRSTKRRNRY